MADPIPLPPLPVSIPAHDAFSQKWLRARDLEVTRVVLEAAAKHMATQGWLEHAIAILNLEFTHAK